MSWEPERRVPLPTVTGERGLMNARQLAHAAAFVVRIRRALVSHGTGRPDVLIVVEATAEDWRALLRALDMDEGL